ncbi:MAG: tetratricopeptide repeat protein [Nibricoccus sp.]
MPAIPSPLEKALALHRAGQLVEAALLYREFLRKQPNHPDALNLLGLLRQQTGEHAQAVECFTKAMAVVSRNALLHVNRAQSYRAVGRVEEAEADFRQALQIDAKQAEAHHQLGNLLKALNRHGEALQSLRCAAELAPKNPAVWLNLGVSLLAVSEQTEAIQSFQKAVALEPNRVEALNILGSALVDVGKFGEARNVLEKALQLRPSYAPAHDNLGRLYRAQGRPAEAVAEFRAALTAQNAPSTHSNLVYALNFVPQLSAGEVFAEHLNWARLHAASVATPRAALPLTRDPARPLRIGYVSPDFIHHAVSYFIEPVLKAHDRSAFEVYCYSNAPASDNVTQRLRSLGHAWRDISRLDDDAAANVVREDKIDILVDLAGHTARNRLLLFARKPAPVQVTWLGYPNTTGLSAIDWRLTDEVSDPAGATDRFYAEKLFRLRGPFSVYLPSDDAPAVEAPPVLRNGYITFGSFNHFAKVNSAVVELWARLLARVPNARFVMKARSLADSETAARVLSTFERLGVTADRLELRSEELPVAAHLARFNEIDIALDTFPYNGTTTTCEALWMGVPVVALAGSSHVSRVSASLLTHLGHPEWIGASEADYIERAYGLAADPQKLASLRASQRDKMRLSPLCDAARFTRELEEAYRQMAEANRSRS